VKFLKRATNVLTTKNKIEVLGPFPSIPSKVKGNSRFHLLLKSPTKAYLNKILGFLADEFVGWPETKKIKWSFDIDPHDMS